MSDPLPSSSSALHRPRDDDHHDDDHNGEVYQPLFGGGDANQQVLPSRPVLSYTHQPTTLAPTAPPSRPLPVPFPFPFPFPFPATTTTTDNNGRRFRPAVAGESPPFLPAPQRPRPRPPTRSAPPRPAPARRAEPTNIEAASPWRADDWRTSDDRVRGGASQSFLTIIEGGRDAGPGAPTPGPPTPPAAAVFHGHLDHHTLGGAGFASQRTAAHGVPGAPWHLGASEGVVLVIERKKKKQVMDDDKMFTFILTDTLPAPEQDPHTGREQAVLLYEYDFRVSTGLAEEGEEEVELEGEVEGEREVVRVYVPFAEMRPTYRGREKSGATPLDRTSVKRVAIMIRR